MGAPDFFLVLLTFSGPPDGTTTVTLAGAKVQGSQVIIGPSTSFFCDLSL